MNKKELFDNRKKSHTQIQNERKKKKRKCIAIVNKNEIGHSNVNKENPIAIMRHWFWFRFFDFSGLPLTSFTVYCVDFENVMYKNCVYVFLYR